MARNCQADGGGAGTLATRGCVERVQRVMSRTELELRATLEVPAGTFSPATRMDPRFNMPGGGHERTATGNVPARVVEWEVLK